MTLFFTVKLTPLTRGLTPRMVSKSLSPISHPKHSILPSAGTSLPEPATGSFCPGLIMPTRYYPGRPLRSWSGSSPFPPLVTATRPIFSEPILIPIAILELTQLPFPLCSAAKPTAALAGRRFRTFLLLWVGAFFSPIGESFCGGRAPAVVCFPGNDSFVLGGS
jgi:hypothetical protein